MKYENLKQAHDDAFRRITGVKRKTFATMLAILTEAEQKKKAQGGRPHKLDMPTRLLMTLEYLREYRTYAHIGMSYGLAESNVYKTIRWVEDTLAASKEFRLPGKQALSTNDPDLEVVLIDATETPIERPKKTEKVLFRKKEEAYY